MRIFFLLVLLGTSFSNSLHGAYVQFGSGIGRIEESKGTEIYIGVGLFEYKGFTFGVAGDLGMYGPNYSPIKNINRVIDYIDNPTSDLSGVLKYRALTNSMLTADMDVFGKRGLHVFGGLGYGFYMKPTPTADSIVYMVQQLANANGDISVIANDPRMREEIFKLVNRPNELRDLIVSVLGDSPALSEIVNNPDKLRNLIDDDVAREQFLSDLRNDIDSRDFSIDRQFVCNTVFSCNTGLVYQMGIGYDLQVYKAFGIDAYGKVRGMMGFEPAYIVGVNASFRW